MLSLTTSNTTISVVVPVKNGMDTLEQFIAGIELQTLFDQLEVVAIDSGSTDGSLDYLSSFSFVKLISIDPQTFNHGSTRNQAVAHCKGEFIFMTVQDAWTDDPLLLERMHAHFIDTRVMGVCGHQIVPHINTMNPHKWFRPQTEPQPRAVSFAAGEFAKLTPQKQFEHCGWDNVIAMYRKSALKKLPFITTDFAEDLNWAKDALLNGWTLVYDHRNRVNHYHHAYPDYVFKRIFIELYAIYKHFNYTMDVGVNFSHYARVVVRNFKWHLPQRWIWFNLRALKAKDKANTLFHKCIKEGDAVLEKTYKDVCGVIPQGQLTIKKRDTNG
jgi:rhamnosyltransferase